VRNQAQSALLRGCPSGWTLFFWVLVVRSTITFGVTKQNCLISQPDRTPAVVNLTVNVVPKASRTVLSNYIGESVKINITNVVPREVRIYELMAPAKNVKPTWNQRLRLYQILPDGSLTGPPYERTFFAVFQTTPYEDSCRYGSSRYGQTQSSSAEQQIFIDPCFLEFSDRSYLVITNNFDQPISYQLAIEGFDLVTLPSRENFTRTFNKTDFPPMEPLYPPSYSYLDWRQPGLFLVSGAAAKWDWSLYPYTSFAPVVAITVKSTRDLGQYGSLTFETAVSQVKNGYLQYAPGFFGNEQCSRGFAYGGGSGLASYKRLMSYDPADGEFILSAHQWDQINVTVQLFALPDVPLEMGQSTSTPSLPVPLFRINATSTQFSNYLLLSLPLIRFMLTTMAPQSNGTEDNSMPPASMNSSRIQGTLCSACKFFELGASTGSRSVSPRTPEAPRFLTWTPAQHLDSILVIRTTRLPSV
jgi:hypothetical protein